VSEVSISVLGPMVFIWFSRSRMVGGPPLHSYSFFSIPPLVRYYWNSLLIGI
jgi:hypothetical protein